jgi:hypothetical protein
MVCSFLLLSAAAVLFLMAVNWRALLNVSSSPSSSGTLVNTMIGGCDLIETYFSLLESVLVNGTSGGHILPTIFCTVVFHRVCQGGKQSDTARMSTPKASDTRNSGEGKSREGRGQSIFLTYRWRTCESQSYVVSL